jgi:hypothetical protein
MESDAAEPLRRNRARDVAGFTATVSTIGLDHYAVLPVITWCALSLIQPLRFGRLTCESALHAISFNCRIAIGFPDGIFAARILNGFGKGPS